MEIEFRSHQFSQTGNQETAQAKEKHLFHPMKALFDIVYCVAGISDEETTLPIFTGDTGQRITHNDHLRTSSLHHLLISLFFRSKTGQFFFIPSSPYFV